MVRHAAKVDNSQQDIVRDLRKCGYLVEIIQRPVDLLVRHNSWRAGVFVALEIKVSNRKDGGYTPRKDQPEQIAFCEAHGVPYITSTEQALVWLVMFDLT